MATFDNFRKPSPVDISMLSPEDNATEEKTNFGIDAIFTRANQNIKDKLELTTMYTYMHDSK